MVKIILDVAVAVMWWAFAIASAVVILAVITDTAYKFFT